MKSQSVLWTDGRGLGEGWELREKRTLLFLHLTPQATFSTLFPSPSPAIFKSSKEFSLIKGFN